MKRLTVKLAVLTLSCICLISTQKMIATADNNTRIKPMASCGGEICFPGLGCVSCCAEIRNFCVLDAMAERDACYETCGEPGSPGYDDCHSECYAIYQNAYADCLGAYYECSRCCYGW